MPIAIQNIQRMCAPILRHAGVKRSAIFGSFARGEAGKKSDVDFLVEFKPGASLLNLVALEEALGQALKRDVDVVTYNAISPSMRDRILKDAVSIL